ncbi:MAG: hypothetical protein ACI8RD_001621 [Bacillariaceae sp.]|jgi:hypothetical protein
MSRTTIRRCCSSRRLLFGRTSDKNNSFSTTRQHRKPFLNSPSRILPIDFQFFNICSIKRRGSSQQLRLYHDDYLSTSTKKSTKKSNNRPYNICDNSKIKILESKVSNLNDDEIDTGGVIYTCHDDKTKKKEDIITWNVTNNRNKDNDPSLYIQLQTISKKMLSTILPAQYPKSVSQGYLGFASFCFTASVAGSAAMVLSTQTLLLAVGIVGQNIPHASIMAGALNWILKDFIGQLGGIIFASRMGKTKAFDSDPKRWRMISAIALDSATLLEILSPLFHQSMILPVASIANIGKNIGFLTASASRAALHQSLAISGNLGDVTAKSGSQSILASLVGTSLGIGLSTTILQHDTFNFGICFICLSAIHQGCTFMSLRNVPLTYLNRHRLHLVLEEYLQSEKILAPIDIAKVEQFVPFLSNDSTRNWLNIGRPMGEVCRSPNDLDNCLMLVPDEEYLIKFHKNTHEIDLIYFIDAKEDDILRGMYHAYRIRHTHQQMTMSSAAADTSGNIQPQSSNREKTSSNNEMSSCEGITLETHIEVEENFPHLFEQLRTQGWNIGSKVTNIEDSNASRIRIKS